MSNKELDDVLTVEEKAKRHLQTWTKKRLISQLAMSAKRGWLEQWADKYDQEDRHD